MRRGSSETCGGNPRGRERCGRDDRERRARDGARRAGLGAAMRSLTFAFSSLRAILEPRPASSAARSWCAPRGGRFKRRVLGPQSSGRRVRLVSPARLSRSSVVYPSSHYRLSQPPPGHRHGHLRCTKFAPCSSYSCLLIHICWNEPSDARMDPPIQVANLRSTAF